VIHDNKSILSNISVPSSMLKKKSNSIAYNFSGKELLEMSGDLTM